MVCFQSSLNKNASKHGNIKLGIAGQQGSIIVRGWLRVFRPDFPKCWYLSDCFILVSNRSIPFSRFGVKILMHAIYSKAAKSFVPKVTIVRVMLYNIHFW